MRVRAIGGTFTEKPLNSNTFTGEGKLALGREMER